MMKTLMEKRHVQLLLLFSLLCCLLIVSSEGKEEKPINVPDDFVSQLDKAASSVDQSAYSVCSNGEWTNSNEQHNSCISVSCHSVYEVCGTTLMYMSTALNLSLNLRINNDNNGTDSDDSIAKAYGYGSIMIVFISLLSLLGLFIVPCLTRANSKGQLIIRYLLTLLTAMGVSALMCGVMFELIPTTFRVDSGGLSESEIVWKATGVVGGVLIFYVLESILQILVDTTKKNGNLELKTVGQNVDENKSLLLANGITKAVKDAVTAPSNDETLFQKVCSFKQVRPLAWMILIGELLHNAADGITVGAAVSQSLALGLSTTIAIGLHEIPHEIADFGILVKSGMHWLTALMFNFLSSLTAIVGFFIGVAISTNSATAKEWLLAIAAGSFLYIALADLLPELKLSSFHCHDPDAPEQLEYTTNQKIGHGFVIGIGFLIAYLTLLTVSLNEENLNNLF